MPTPKQQQLESADHEIRETLRRSRERQGLPPTITDEATLAAVQSLLDHAGDE